MTNAVIGRSQAADIGLRHSREALYRAHVIPIASETRRAGSCRGCSHCADFVMKVHDRC